MAKQADFRVDGHGSVFMVEPLTARGKKWVEENVPLEDWQWLGPRFSVEHRYIDDLIEGIRNDGLTVDHSSLRWC
jgi:hypothetical protein